MFRALLLVWLAVIGLPVVAATLRDPMQPPAQASPQKKAAPAESYRLTAITVRAERRSAVINGQVLREGAWFEGARVVEIQPSQVKLQGPRGEVVLRLAPNVKKNLIVDKGLESSR